MKELELHVLLVEIGPLQPVVDKAGVPSPLPSFQALQIRIVVVVEQALQSTHPVFIGPGDPFQDPLDQGRTQDGFEPVMGFLRRICRLVCGRPRWSCKRTVPGFRIHGRTSFPPGHFVIPVGDLQCREG